MARTDAFAAAARELAKAVLAAAADPADGVRLLLPLAQWEPPEMPGRGPLATAIEAAHDALAANLRMAACAALAQATLEYRPVSYQDAHELRRLISCVLEVEATRAADAGRDASYGALRDLRAAVALDLEVRGAALAVLVEVTTRAPMPSLAEAWTLYQDTTREPALVASAQPAHPLFLPLTFPALAR